MNQAFISIKKYGTDIYKVRISIGGYMFFESPPTSLKSAKCIKQNLHGTHIFITGEDDK